MLHLVDPATLKFAVTKEVSPTLRATYKVVGETKIDVDVYLPPPSDVKSYPVILTIHGGAFMLGSASMCSKDQIADCLDRGWIVLAVEHRLCPQLDMLEGPIQDCRDALNWVYDGGLDKELAKKEGTASYKSDFDKVMVWGTSSGGHLALSMGFGVKKPVRAILDFYGAKNFADPFWDTEITSIKEKLPKTLTPEFINKIYEGPVPVWGGVSLEGQAQPGPPKFDDPRQAFAMTQIANGTVLKACFPSGDWKKIDPVENVTPDFPPTIIVHGLADIMIPIDMSRALLKKLKDNGVKCDMIEIPGEPHTFVGAMKKGTQTWDMQRKGFDWLQKIIDGQ